MYIELDINTMLDFRKLMRFIPSFSASYRMLLHVTVGIVLRVFVNVTIMSIQIVAYYRCNDVLATVKL